MLTQTLQTKRELCIYVDSFQRSAMNNQNLVQALADAFKLYGQMKSPSVETTQAMSNFLLHAYKSSMGQKIINNPFACELPLELQKLLEVATLREMSLAKASSRFILDCETHLAKNDFSPKAFFQQCARLEQGLQQMKIEKRHYDEAHSSLNQWIKVLFQKFASLILEGPDLGTLEVAIDDDFMDSECIGLPVLTKFKEYINQQMVFLTEQGFFETFYNSSVAAQYDYVFDFCSSHAKEITKIPYLKLVLESLYEQQLEMAYKSCNQYIYQMMCDPNITLDDITRRNKHTKDWRNTHWKEHKDSHLRKVLDEHLEQHLATFKEWQNVSNIESKSNSPHKQPLYVLQTIKNYYSPRSPHDVLHAMLEQTPDVNTANDDVGIDNVSNDTLVFSQDNKRLNESSILSSPTSDEILHIKKKRKM